MIKLKELLKRFFESIVSNTLYDVLKLVFTVLVVGAAGSLAMYITHSWIYFILVALSSSILSIVGYKIITEHNSFYETLSDECRFHDFEIKPLNTWEEVFSIPNISIYQTGLHVCQHILKRSLWKKYFEEIKIPAKYWLPPNNVSVYFNIDLTFPHLKIVMFSMLGKPVYYIGKPYILAGIGSQNSRNLWPILAFSLTELFILCEKKGVKKELLDIYIKDYLKECAAYFLCLQYNPESMGLGKNAVNEHLTDFFRFFSGKEYFREIFLNEVMKILKTKET